MIYKFLENPIKYDGSQLRGLYAYLNHGILGDSLVSFTGACDISFEKMVDGEDLLAEAKICGDNMLHFIGEAFGVSLDTMVHRQRLFAGIVFEYLIQKGIPNLRRDGDDIFQGSKKLSISVATATPVSSLLHFAVNITNSGTPVDTLSLEDLQIDPRSFSDGIAENYLRELKTIKEAGCKVRWVP